MEQVVSYHRDGNEETNGNEATQLLPRWLRHGLINLLLLGLLAGLDAEGIPICFRGEYGRRGAADRYGHVLKVVG